MSVVRVKTLYDQLRTKRSPRARDVRKLLDLATTVSRWPMAEENKRLVVEAREWARLRSDAGT